MTTRFALANQKGGVGKTTTAVNLGAALAATGMHTLVVDVDPQGNATAGLGVDRRDVKLGTYEILLGDAEAASAVLATGFPNLDVIPSTAALAGAEIELVDEADRGHRLRNGLRPLDGRHEVILIDCPPALGLLTVNALAAADAVIVPVQCEYYALEGLGQLRDSLDRVRAGLNPALRLAGIVLTMYDGRTRLSAHVAREVRAHFAGRVFRTVVPRSVRLAEAPSFGEPVERFDPSSRGAFAYRALAKELLERLDRGEDDEA